VAKKVAVNKAIYGCGYSLGFSPNSLHLIDVQRLEIISIYRQKRENNLFVQHQKQTLNFLKKSYFYRWLQKTRDD